MVLFFSLIRLHCIKHDDIILWVIPSVGSERSDYCLLAVSQAFLIIQSNVCAIYLQQSNETIAFILLQSGLKDFNKL